MKPVAIFFFLLLYTDRTILKKCLKVHITPKYIFSGITSLYCMEENAATSCAAG